MAALFAMAPAAAHAAPPDLGGKTGWTAVMYGSAQDPHGDSQAGAADTDIIADPTHGSLYVGFSDGGTVTTADDYLYFRLRIDNPTSSSPPVFNGVGVVGIDANLDGKLDIFVMVDGRNNSQVVRLMDPGTGSNTSPSTTTTTPLPSGWLPNNGIYSFTTALYQSVQVTSGTDPHWNGDDDLSNDGQQDIFVSWRIPMSDLATVLAIPSPVDRNGNYGPRGATGIQNYTKDTISQYVAFTQTQSGPINGDLNGVGASYDKNATFASLGAFTAPMSAANPVSASDAVTITDPVDANGYINAAEDDSVTVIGTAKPVSSWVKLSATDGVTTVTTWVQSNGSGAWTTSLNVSTLAEGTITFTAELVTGNLSNTVVANSSGDTATAIHDSVPPTITVNPVTTSGFPTISGTSTGIAAGSVITVAIDPNGDGILTDLVTYQVVVDSSGNWSVNTAVVSPSSGTMPSSGLTAYATVSASGSDLAGNTTTSTGVTRPTVNSITTNDTTPTITGTWGGSNGGTDVLSVTVNGVTYTAGDGNLVVTGNTWTLTIPPGDALTTGGSPYDVTTTVTRSGTPYSNTSTASLAVVSGPAVSITSATPQSTAKPTITGTSTIVSGTVTVRIDPNNDGIYTDAIYYSVSTDGSGNWSLNTGSAFPYSGTFPISGITGTMGILVSATDSGGVTATASQTLTTSVPSISITSIFSTAVADTTGTITNSDFVINRREDDAITVSGTSSSAVGLTVTVTVSDGDAGTTDPSGTATVAGDGSWSVTGLSLGALRDGYLTFNAAVTGASAVNTSYTHDASVPLIRFTTVSTIDKNGNAVGGVVTGSSDLAPGSIINLTFSSGASGSPTATVQANGDWSYTHDSTISGSTVTVTATADITATDKSGNKPAAAVSATFATTASYTPASGVIVISTIAGDDIITSGEASSVVISGTSSQGSGTVTITVTNSAGTQVFSTTATIATNATAGTNIWSTSGLNFSSTTPNGPLIVTATVVSTVNSYTYKDVALPTLQLGTVGAGTPPTIVITTVGDGNISASEATAVTIAGTTTSVPDGSTVTITISDTSGGTSDIVTTTTVTSGAWSKSVDVTSQVDGALTFSVSVTANSQTATDSATVQKDTVANAISITSGPSVSDSTPLLAGTTTLPAGSILTVGIDLDHDGVIDLTYTVTVQSGDTWSVDTGTATPTSGTFPVSGIPAAASVVVTGTDGAGNTTTAVSTSITAITSDNGVSSTDFITNDPTLIFSGRGMTNQTVTLVLTNSSGTIILGNSTTVNSSGNWSYDFTGTTLPSGTYGLLATVTASPATATAFRTIVVDTVAPTASTVTISGDTGTSGTDYDTADNTLVYSGTADSFGSVQVTLKDSGNNTIFASSLTADGSGNWTLDKTGSTLPDGTYTLTVVTTDSAGNVTTVIKTIIIDTTAEIVITTNATTSDTTPLITGTTDLEVGQTITVDIDADNNGLYDDGPTHTYTTTVQSGGVWQVEATTTLSPGTVNVRATGSDLAGNSATATKVMVVDVNAPTLTITEPIGDGNLNASEDNSVTIQGTSTFIPDGNTITVTITDGTTTISDTTTVTSGAWSLLPLNLSSLGNGVLTVTATYSDAGGNIYSDTATVLHDKSGTTTIDSIGTDTGLLSDFITYDTTLIFNGSASPNDLVTLTLTSSSGAVVFTTTVTADASGNWTYDFTGTTLTNDTYTLKADTGTIGLQAFTVDTVPPTGPATVAPQSTSDTTPTITGTVNLGPGETLSVTVNGVTYTDGDGNLSTDGFGNWTLTIPAGNELDPAVSGGFSGVYTVVATITDTAGNTTSSSNNITITSGIGATLTAATGGSAISADNFGTGTYVALTGPSYAEGAAGDVTTGTIILNVPTGFIFDTGSTVTVLVTGSATAADNINDLATGSTISATVSTTQITITITAASATANTLTWQGIRVRPTAGTPLASGNIVMDASSTATLSTVTAGTTNFGTLTEVSGAFSGYSVTAASGTVNAGSSDQLTISRVDQYGNTVTTFTGDTILTFSGLGTSAAGNVPTVTNKSGSAVDFGSATTITFTAGVSTVGGNLVPYRAETATVEVTDGTHSTSSAGGSGATITVSEGAATAYRITAASSTPAAGATDVLTIRQVDQYGNTVTSLTGDVVLTFSGLGNSPTGSVPTITDKTTAAINEGTATTITFTSGVATAGGTLIAYKTETATLSVTDGTLTSSGTGGTGATLTVGAGTASAYQVTAASGTPTVGSSDALTIKQVDAYGNTVTGLSGDVVLTFSGLGTAATGNTPTVTDKTSNPVNLGTGTTITFTSGVSTAGSSLVPYLAESATLDVTDGTHSSTDTGGSGAALVISSGTISGYRITAANATPTAGSSDALTIRQVDQYGNTVPGFSGDVVLTFSGLSAAPGGNVPTVTDKNGSATDLGTATTITFTSGVATVGGTLVPYAVGTSTLQATDGTYSTATTGGAGAALTVSAGTATKLVFTTQPDKAELDTAFVQQPVVKTQDNYGNPSTTGLPASLSVTVTLTSGTGSLSGTATLDIGTSAGNGTVSFTDLQISAAGSGKQLTAAASGLTDGLSSAFEVWTIYMTSDDVIVADRGPYYSTGTILISRGSSPASAVIITSIKDPYEVSREPDGNFVVVDYETSRGGGLFRINRLTFAVTTVSSGGNFVVPFGVKVESKAPNAGKILVADLDAFSQAGAIFRVNPTTGAQTTLTQGGNFYFLQGLAIAPTGTPNDGDIYVTSVGDGSAITSKLIKVDPSTGAQTIISSAGNFDYPVGMAVESDGNILVVDAKAKKVIRVNPGTGVQTVLSDAANTAQGSGLNTFLLPTHVALDASGNLYVSDGKVNAGVNERLLFKVDKTTGNRTLVTKDGFFEQPRGLQIIP